MNNPTHFSLRVQTAYPLTIWGVMPCHRVDTGTIVGGNLMPPTFSAGSFKMMMTVYQTMECHITEDHNPNIHDCE